jgi:concanavalin A-like lectin/glucanase superfamily protein/type IX secretion system substrate protein
MIMKKYYFLLVMLIVNTYAIAQYSLYEMVLYYPVEKAISGDTIYDISGYQTHGVLHNIELTTDRNGHENSAISFNGTSSYIQMDCPYFSKPEYCYSLWVKVYSNPSYGESDVLVSIGTEYGIDQFLMNTSHYSLNDHLGWLGGGYHVDQSHAFVRLQTPSTEGEWIHITYLRNSEILQLFINGEYVESSNVNVQAPYFGDDFIGNIGRRVNGTQYYYGAMDDIRIFERMLESDEIMEAYLQEGIPEPLVDAGLDQIISLSTLNVQISGNAKLYTSLNWSTSGDGFFSETSVEDPIYYPGTGDLNSETTNLILTCTGYSEDSEIITDTVKLVNSSLGIDAHISDLQLSVFPNPISKQNRRFYIESSTINLSNIKEVHLINAHGQVINVKQPTVINHNSISVPCDHLQNGIYLLILDGIRTSKKIIVND